MKVILFFFFISEIDLKPCTESELIQFSARFIEWMSLVKVIDDSDEFNLLDLQALVTASRRWGRTLEEKRDILKV